MVTASQRAHYTRVAAAYVRECKQPGEAVGVAVEPAPGGWTAVVKIGDVGVRASCGADPGDDVVRAVLAGALADARAQAALGDAVTARRRQAR